MVSWVLAIYKKISYLYTKDITFINPIECYRCGALLSFIRGDGFAQGFQDCYLVRVADI